MELASVRLDQSSPGRVRLTGEVRYDGQAATEEYWYEVPERYALDLTSTGNPWLVCLAPLAATLGEPLRIGLPVDRLLVRNVLELLAIWRLWYPSLQTVPIDVEPVGTPAGGAATRTGVFFSGGVDSFFTVLRHQKAVARDLWAEDLILVRGFDFPLEHQDAFERHRERMARVADDLGMELVDIVTNLRETRLQKARWGELSHGSALVSVGLALEKRYRFLLVASSSAYGEVAPWGTHPLTDALLSTQSTQVIHDGAAYTRLDKTRFVAGSSVVLRSLHVCFRRFSDLNCGRCRKCSLTMLALALVGALERCTTFPPGGPDLGRVSRILLSTPGQRRGALRLRALALRRKRKDIVRALNRALRRSAVLSPLLVALDRLSRSKGFWRVTLGLRRTLLGVVVR